VRALDFVFVFGNTETDLDRWFLKFNPNGRLPAITDGSTRVFESGAIMLYLVDKYDSDRKISYEPGDVSGYTEQLSWLMWQMGGLGPMQGTVNGRLFDLILQTGITHVSLISC
jgi:glutathione S-transferase